MEYKNKYLKYKSKYIFEKNNLLLNNDTQLGSFELKKTIKYNVINRIKIRINNFSKLKIIPAKNENIFIRIIYNDIQDFFYINKIYDLKINRLKDDIEKTYLLIIEGNCIVYDYY